MALATYAGAPQLAPDDQLLVAPLERLGAEVAPVVWSSDAAWDRYDVVVIRSCWDYHRRIGRFRRWLDTLDAAGVRVLNPARLVRWNADKRYLFDLAKRGHAVVPTAFVPRGGGDEVERIAAAEDWRRVVLKPAISASGHDTHALSLPLDAAARAIVAGLTRGRDTLVQPLIDEVRRDGELSLVFIDGEYSHALRKRARAGEFRVQAEHGGSAAPIVPHASTIAQAAAMIHGLDDRPVYARVDGVERGGAFLLMELELIEPNLYLEFAPAAAERLAERIIRAATGSP